MSTRFLLTRHADTPRSTWGELAVVHLDDETGFQTKFVLCNALERGLSNPDGHPRIPAGAYHVVRKPLGASHFDAALTAFPIPGYKGILWINPVAGRENIEIHTANFVEQLLGCVATGEDVSRDDKGDYCIAHSKAAYAKAYPPISQIIDAEGFALLEITDPPPHEGAP